MRRLTAIPVIALILMMVTIVSPAFASGGTGQIRIWPPLPTMLSSPATFHINVTSGSSYYPQILLVMSDASYQGLTGNVIVQWTSGSVSFVPSDFTGNNTNGDNVPPTGTTNGASYTVASLKSHLGVNDTIWWAYKPFLSSPLTGTLQEFIITLPSTHPKMLVYALGKSTNSPTALFDMKVPNTIPGLVIPEAATIALALSPFAGMGLYAIRRRRK